MSRSETREAVLRVAWRLMKEDAASVTLGRIAQEAGVSRQALYLHFAGRAGLLLAMVRWVDEREQFFEKVGTLAALGEPRAELEGCVRTWLDYLPRLHPVPGFLARAKDEPAARDAWQDRMAALEALYRKPMKVLESEGRLREGMSVEAGVQAVRAIASVHAWEQLVHGFGWSQRRAVDALWLAAAGAVFPVAASALELRAPHGKKSRRKSAPPR